MAGEMSVLIVDDNTELRELLEQGLEIVGFKVYQAGDGPTGIEMARKKKPKIILLDITMEGMDGLEVLAELKSSDETKDIPVVMLTGTAGMGEVERALEIGAIDYLTKPVELMKLGPMLREKLASAGRGSKREVSRFERR